MNETECREAYDQLAQVLRDHELGWVVDQVEETTRRGKPHEVEVAMVGDNQALNASQPALFSDTPVRVKRGPRERLQRVDEFSDCERLVLLAAAGRRATVEVADIELATCDWLHGLAGSKLSAITFVDDATAEVSYRITMDEPRRKRDELQPVDRLLIELEKEAKQP